MQIYYERVDITRDAEIVAATVRESAGEQADALEVTMQNPSQWNRWQPKRGERVEAVRGDYTTGTMYVDTLMPDNGKYRLLASSMTAEAGRRRWQSYEQCTLKDIVASVAAETGMEYGIFGIDERTEYTYMLRQNETAAGFLSRILRMEGAILKCAFGRLSVVGIEYAQSLAVTREIRLTSETSGVKHRRAEGMAYAACEIISPYGHGNAVDVAVENGITLTLADEPVYNDIQAARWARGALLWENRKAETLTFQTDFDASLTAMTPVVITGGESYDGYWMTDAVEHDLYNGSTRCGLMRFVETVR